MQYTQQQNPWKTFHGPNLGYLLEQYDLFTEDPESVDESIRALFINWGAPQIGDTQLPEPSGNQELSPSMLINKMNKLLEVFKLAYAIRSRGHLEASIYPLERQEPVVDLSLAHYGLTEQDVREIPAELICPEMGEKLSDGLAAIQYLKKTYADYVGFEFDHIEPEEKAWFKEKIESGFIANRRAQLNKRELLTSLYKAESFEQFLQKTYVGQKRFSVEGLETLVPAIDEIVKMSAKSGLNDVVISMAHRGRLNVLTHVMQRPYEAIFSQFQHSKYDEDVMLDTSTGDVKYHMGAVTNRKIGDQQIRLTLANNPSHLEIAGSVVEGFARAAQEDRSKAGYPKQDVTKALAILVHGDAAFPGQGVVAETLNYSQTRAYQTGGTIHIIANNRIGFTTESEDSRSTRYSSDMAKGFNIPIIHVNADHPESALAVMQLAFEYRQTFHKDVLVDLIGYRRLGHNEMDEPMATNPVMYQVVRKHSTITGVYSNQCYTEKSLVEREGEEVKNQVLAELENAYKKVSAEHEEIRSLDEMLAFTHKEFPEVDTTVDRESLVSINAELLKWQDNFNVFGKLKKILERRLGVFDKNTKIDWAHAEALAFATILKDGTPIRLTGQDSERGTFSHRNIVLSDEVTGQKYSPMHTLSAANASFAVHNSSLSEAAVLGFEYGYNVFSPETLVLWEAQFGDFANGAQIVIDQFISAGKAKWGQKSGMVMLLPHGYEGQGPEHSSARLERFLQLSAENNWTVANLSSSAQYFHILRRQAAVLESDSVRPLVLMAPKSLLRHASAASQIEEFTNGEFQPIIEQPGLGMIPEKVERLVFCTGRLAVDISDHVADGKGMEWLNIIRVEELYPFPEDQIRKIMKNYKNLKEVIWTQEEPKNMGAWSYIAPRLQEVLPKDLKVTYNGRPDMSSPSEGNPAVHKEEQQRIINQVLTPSAIKVMK